MFSSRLFPLPRRNNGLDCGGNEFFGRSLSDEFLPEASDDEEEYDETGCGQRGMQYNILLPITRGENVQDVDSQ